MPFYIDKMTQDYMGLTRNFTVNPYSCKNPLHYENYLKFCAISDQKRGIGVTHVLIDEHEETKQKKIAGFITLKATSLTKSYEDYDEGHPALEIAELAIDKEYERRGLGTLLVQFAITTAAILNEEFLGIEYVVLCADPEAVNFYSKDTFGFKRLEEYYNVPREGWNVNCIPMFLKVTLG